METLSRPASRKNLSPQSLNFLSAVILGTLRHPTGKLIRRLPPVFPKSLTKQFFNALNAQFTTDATSTKTTAGGVQNQVASTLNFRSDTAAGETTAGLLLGSGQTAPIVTDHKLETPVTANLTHGAQTVLNESFGVNGWRITLTRSFTNTSANPISINEIAWYVNDGGSLYCYDRSLYIVSIAAGKVLTLSYRFSSGA